MEDGKKDLLVIFCAMCNKFKWRLEIVEECVYVWGRVDRQRESTGPI